MIANSYLIILTLTMKTASSIQKINTLATDWIPGTLVPPRDLKRCRPKEITAHSSNPEKIPIRA